jgi:hypothetical protein
MRCNCGYYSYEVTCALCGEVGVAPVRDTGRDWLGAEFFHEDPQVCRENLKRRAEHEAQGKEENR